VGHLGPARRCREQVGLEVLNTVIGGSFTSRLNQNLREEHGFTYGVSSSFNLMRRAGTFSVRTSVERAATVPALREIDRELRRLCARGVRQAELDKATRLALEDLPARAETVRGLVNAYGELWAGGASLQDLRRQPARVAALTTEELHALARRFIRPAEAAVVVVGDMEQLRGELERTFGPGLLLDPDGVPQG